jgi:lysophospholipase L1-like esterase
MPGQKQRSARRALQVERLEDRCYLAGTIVDHADLDAVALFPTATMDLIGEEKWLFTHASVGGNIVEGLDTLHSQNPTRYQVATAYVGYNDASQRADAPPATTVPGTLYECNRGNPGWDNKLTIFQNSVNLAGWHDAKVDAVMDKYCYIDETADAAATIAGLSALEAAYPKTRVVYVTMPLTTDADSTNVQRNTYNNAIRAYCSANDRLLFDLADMEAHAPNGTASTFTQLGVTYQKLYSGYSSDGGHLNAAGQQRIATGWYAVAARVAGDVTKPTVTINQAAGQADHAAAGPVRFSVVFSEPVEGFSAEDVELTGSVRGTPAAEVTGSGTTYEVAVTGMTRTGTIVARIPAGAAHDAAGNASEESTSTDNVVLYDPCNVDVDGDGSVVPLQDGLLILRYLFDFRNGPLVRGLLGTGATRVTPAEVTEYLDDASISMLEVDASGETTGLTDGLLMLRYLSGFRGTSLVAGVLSKDAARTDPQEIVSFLDSYFPSQSAKGQVGSKSEPSELGVKETGGRYELAATKHIERMSHPGAGQESRRRLLSRW